MLRYACRLIITTNLLALVPSSLLARQSPDQTVFRLSKINVVGSVSYTRDQVIAMSGLKEGQPVRLADFAAAVDRLTASGFFRNVAYRYAYTGVDAEITLEVVEDKFRARIIFDNFIWFKDQELIDAIRQEVPTFDGTSPASAAALNAIKRPLDAFLQQKIAAGEFDPHANCGPSGCKEVEYVGQIDLYNRSQLEIFSLKGAEFPVCAIEFQGVGSDHLSELKEKSKPLLKGQYSRAFTSAFVSGNLIPVYRSKGYLRARFQDSQAAASADSKCSRGVTLRLAVDEGSPYTWLKAEWTGNTSIPAAQLDAALQMKAGEIANGVEMDSGLAAVREAYGRRGYIGLRISSQPTYEDPEHRVAFKFGVDEGPQYHMGDLVMTTLSEKEAARIKSKWKLAQGDVFDANYFKEFVTKELSGQSLSGARDFDVTTRPDRQTLKVDVVITPSSDRSK
jgi:outer membrane protein assembly factor BamA